MSRRRNYSEDTLAIMARYFEALDRCIEMKIIKNISWYCDNYKIDKRHLYAQRADRSKGYFEVGWLRSLIDDCMVSPLWLMTGLGGMFSREQRIRKA